MASSIDDGGSYCLMNFNSRTVMDLNDGNNDNGTKVQGWDMSLTTTSRNQVWKFQKNGDFWRIINRASGSSLDLNRGSAENGTKIQGWAANDSGAQRWAMDPHTEEGQICYYRIRNDQGNTYIDLNDGDNDNGTQIQGWEADTLNRNQRWILLKVG